jgi:hypothetical protein
MKYCDRYRIAFNSDVFASNRDNTLTMLWYVVLYV